MRRDHSHGYSSDPLRPGESTFAVLVVNASLDDGIIDGSGTVSYDDLLTESDVRFTCITTGERTGRKPPKSADRVLRRIVRCREVD